MKKLISLLTIVAVAVPLTMQSASRKKKYSAINPTDLGLTTERSSSLVDSKTRSTPIILPALSPIISQPIPIASPNNYQSSSINSGLPYRSPSNGALSAMTLSSSPKAAAILSNLKKQVEQETKAVVEAIKEVQAFAPKVGDLEISNKTRGSKFIVNALKSVQKRATEKFTSLKNRPQSIARYTISEDEKAAHKANFAPALATLKDFSNTTDLPNKEEAFIEAEYAYEQATTKDKDQQAKTVIGLLHELKIRNLLAKLHRNTESFTAMNGANYLKGFQPISSDLTMTNVKAKNALIESDQLDTIDKLNRLNISKHQKMISEQIKQLQSEINQLKILDQSAINKINAAEKLKAQKQIDLSQRTLNILEYLAKNLALQNQQKDQLIALLQQPQDSGGWFSFLGSTPEQSTKNAVCQTFEEWQNKNELSKKKTMGSTTHNRKSTNIPLLTTRIPKRILEAQKLALIQEALTANVTAETATPAVIQAELNNASQIAPTSLEITPQTLDTNLITPTFETSNA